MYQYRHLTRTVLVCLLLCITSLTAADTIEPSPDETPIEQARTYEKTHNYQQAADMYLITARKMPTPESAEPWRVKAGEMAWMAGNLKQTESIVQGTDESRLNPAMKARLRLLLARIARHNGDYQGVLKQLKFPLEKLSSATRHQVQAMIDEATRQLVKAGQLKPTGSDTNSPELAASIEYWNELDALSPSQIQRRLHRAGTDTEKGWLELAMIGKMASEQARRNAFLRWQRRYPNHPAYSFAVPEIKQTLNTALPGIHQIAVLLPRSGRYAALTDVILEGIDAAQDQLPVGQRPTIRPYNSSQGDITALYQQAVDEGAELVLGPMDKAKVDQLTAASTSAPVITLNYGNDVRRFNPGLYQFALLPEDEAHLAAHRIAELGYQQVAVLVPDSHWGARVGEAFKQQATVDGITIAAQGRFNPRNQDLASVIEKTFKVKDARPQVEVDAIFIVATPRQGRLLKPLLKFYFLGATPVFATSHIYSGEEDPDADSDLNGIQFPEIPWLLKQGSVEAKQEKLPTLDTLNEIAKRHPRLFAFGYDAFNLGRRLLSGSTADIRLNGLSGNLYADRRNRIHRLLGWAKFEHGRPVPLSLPGSIQGM